MKQTPENFYVLTGGPGAGKTTLLSSLQKAGITTAAEDARQIIQQQMAVNGTGLPWKDKTRYAELMFNASIGTYKAYSIKHRAGMVFFDRGILDAVCYMKMEKIPVPPHVAGLVKQHPYNRNVFLLPPWKEIYTTDAERKQTWEEALFTFEKMKETYSEYGYRIIEVPKSSVKERTRFLLDFLKSSEP